MCGGFKAQGVCWAYVCTLKVLRQGLWHGTQFSYARRLQSGWLVGVGHGSVMQGGCKVVGWCGTQFSHATWL